MSGTSSGDSLNSRKDVVLPVAGSGQPLASPATLRYLAGNRAVSCRRSGASDRASSGHHGPRAQNGNRGSRSRAIPVRVLPTAHAVGVLPTVLPAGFRATEGEYSRAIDGAGSGRERPAKPAEPRDGPNRRPQPGRHRLRDRRSAGRAGRRPQQRHTGRSPVRELPTKARPAPSHFRAELANLIAQPYPNDMNRGPRSESDALTRLAPSGLRRFVTASWPLPRCDREDGGRAEGRRSVQGRPAGGRRSARGRGSRRVDPAVRGDLLAPDHWLGPGLARRDRHHPQGLGFDGGVASAPVRPLARRQVLRRFARPKAIRAAPRSRFMFRLARACGRRAAAPTSK